MDLIFYDTIKCESHENNNYAFVVAVSITVTNTDIANLVGPVTIELQYPEHLNGLFIPSAGMITTGGSANTVTCDGAASSCIQGQLVI